MKRLTFDDMTTLSRNCLKTVRRQVNPETVQRALLGASDEVTEAFRMTMGRVNWRRLMDEIDALGPVPEADVLAARLEIVDTALSLFGPGGFLIRPRGDKDVAELDEGERGVDDLAREWEEAEEAGEVLRLGDGVRVRFFGADGNDEEEPSLEEILAEIRRLREEEEDEEDDFAAKWEQAKAAGTATTFADVIKERCFAADEDDEDNGEDWGDEDDYQVVLREDGTEASFEEILEAARRIADAETEEEAEAEKNAGERSFKETYDDLLRGYYEVNAEEDDEEKQKDLAQQWDEMVAAGSEELAEQPGNGDGGEGRGPASWEDILTEDVIKDMFNHDADAHGWPEGPERDALEVQFRELIEQMKSSAPPPRVSRYTRWVRDSDEPEDQVIREEPPSNDNREDGEDGGEDKE